MSFYSIPCSLALRLIPKSSKRPSHFFWFCFFINSSHWSCCFVVPSLFQLWLTLSLWLSLSPLDGPCAGSCIVRRPSASDNKMDKAALETRCATFFVAATCVQTVAASSGEVRKKERSLDEVFKKGGMDPWCHHSAIHGMTHQSLLINR